MFSFNHVTSITVSIEEYAKLSPEQQATCELKADKKSYYMRIGTTIELPETREEIDTLCKSTSMNVGEEMTFGEKKVTYPLWFKYAVVGWKLEINQHVQADYRSGSKTEQRAATLKWYCSGSAERSQEYLTLAMGASTPAAKKALDAWLDERTAERLAGKTL